MILLLSGSPQMNFFDGVVRCEGDDYCLDIPEANDGAGVKIPLTAEIAGKLKGNEVADDRKVTIGIRPEHIRVVHDASERTIRGVVDVSEMMGSELYLHVSAAGRDVVLRVPVTDLLAEMRSGIPYGNEIMFEFPPGLTHIFDPETEKNLLL